MQSTPAKQPDSGTDLDKVDVKRGLDHRIMAKLDTDVTGPLAPRIPAQEPCTIYTNSRLQDSPCVAGCPIHGYTQPHHSCMTVAQACLQARCT